MRKTGGEGLAGGMHIPAARQSADFNAAALESCVLTPGSVGSPRARCATRSGCTAASTAASAAASAAGRTHPGQTRCRRS
jgi:hypothetical protein